MDIIISVDAYHSMAHVAPISSPIGSYDIPPWKRISLPTKNWNICRKIWVTYMRARPTRSYTNNKWYIGRRKQLRYFMTFWKAFYIPGCIWCHLCFQFIVESHLFVLVIEGVDIVSRFEWCILNKTVTGPLEPIDTWLLHWNFNRNLKSLVQENAYKMSSIYVRQSGGHLNSASMCNTVNRKLHNLHVQHYKRSVTAYIRPGIWNVIKSSKVLLVGFMTDIEPSRQRSSVSDLDNYGKYVSWIQKTWRYN